PAVYPARRCRLPHPECHPTPERPAPRHRHSPSVPARLPPPVPAAHRQRPSGPRRGSARRFYNGAWFPAGPASSACQHGQDRYSARPPYRRHRRPVPAGESAAGAEYRSGPARQPIPQTPPLTGHRRPEWRWRHQRQYDRWVCRGADRHHPWPVNRHEPDCSCAPFPWPRRRHQPLRWYLPALHRWHKSETVADVYHRSERRIAWLQPDAGQPVAEPVNAAATARQCAVAPSANGWPASLFSLERLGYRLAILFQQQLYTLLGTAERLLTL